MGMEKVAEFPSRFFCSATKLLLAVYVDDFTLVGPIEAHEGFRETLSGHVDLEPPQDLGRVLGRQHRSSLYESMSVMAFDMEEYA